MVSAGDLFVYSVKIGGQQYYRVAYGSYPSQEQALVAINGCRPCFPRTIRTFAPWRECAARIGNSGGLSILR